MENTSKFCSKKIRNQLHITNRHVRRRIRNPLSSNEKRKLRYHKKYERTHSILRKNPRKMHERIRKNWKNKKQ